MNCINCNDLLSDLLDGTLDNEESALFNAHLEECLSCAGVREELESIIGFARLQSEELVAPPNERALWLRISNTIEAEREFEERAVAASAADAPSPRRESFWANIFGKRWELSFPQLAAAVMAIVVAVALVTAVGVRGLRLSEPLAGGGANSLTATNAGESQNPSYEDYVNRQRAEAEYLRQRVLQRSVRWNPQHRAAFERSMNVVEQAVNESLQELRTNPHDQVSEEMLNAALRQRIELLEEFSEL